jgi:hypothetical protein
MSSKFMPCAAELQNTDFSADTFGKLCAMFGLRPAGLVNVAGVDSSRDCKLATFCLRMFGIGVLDNDVVV